MLQKFFQLKRFFKPFLWGCFGVLIAFLAGCGSFGTLSPTRATSKPYKIKGRWYYPQKHYELTQTGIASYYGGNDRTHGLLTATGERYSMYRMTAAHKTLPLPCIVRVTNLENGRSLILKVNDRGPFKKNRIIDVSLRAAQKLGFYKKGLARVRIKTLVRSSLAIKENRKRFRREALRRR